jgi:hypothetical protein
MGVSTMTRAVLLAVLLVVSVPAMATDLLRCHAKSVVGLLPDGTLQERTNEATPPNTMLGGDAMLWWTRSSIYIIDIADGTVRMDGRPAFQMRIVQEGNGANDTILVPRGLNPMNTTDFAVEDLSDAATDFIRIRQWMNREPIVFMHFALDTMVSGTCEPIQ